MKEIGAVEGREDEKVIWRGRRKMREETLNGGKELTVRWGKGEKGCRKGEECEKNGK